MLFHISTHFSRTDELRRQVYLADLGEILLRYQISVEKRHEVYNTNLLKGLLCYIFLKNNEKSISAKLEDSFSIIELVEKLEGHVVLSPIECYQLYATKAIVEAAPTDQADFEMAPLIDFMESIKPKDVRDQVAKALVLQWEIMIAGREYSYGKVHFI